MSAAAESSASTAGHVVSGDDPRLQQPSDAVPMEHMPQSQSGHQVPAAAADGEVGDGQNTDRPSLTASAPAGASAPDNQDTTASAPVSPKGKEKDDAPPVQSRDRTDSVMAIGPAQETIGSVAPGAADGGPVCNITLLLTSGSRHPYKIDGKYLNRRNVIIPDETDNGLPDPFSISVYTLKELILREWRSDWEAKPASPSSIRLIHFGKLLDDKEQLKSRTLLPPAYPPRSLDTVLLTEK